MGERRPTPRRVHRRSRHPRPLGRGHPLRRLLRLIAFFVWVAWKETTLAVRVLWFIAIILWGNLAMSLYMLIELFRISGIEDLDHVFTRRNPPRFAIPSGLTVIGVAIYTLGFWSQLK